MNSLYRTMFFVPGNDPSKIVKAEIYRPDCIIYDLEDAVSVYEKDAARVLVRRAIRAIRPDCRIGVRINSLDTAFGVDDIKAIVPAKPDFLRLPKTENADSIKELDTLIQEVEAANNIPIGTVKIVASIESAKGVMNAYEIAAASSRMLAIALGAEDFCADMKTIRSETGEEILLARSMIVMAAHAAGILAMDVVYSDVKNNEGFNRNANFGKQLGYTGKSVVHPLQIKAVHDIYTPSDKEIENAQAVMNAYKEAVAHKSGVIALNGKMIDAPMVTRAQYMLEYAKASGKGDGFDA